MIILNIDFKKIDQARLKKGTSKKTGQPFSYGELVCTEFKDGPRTNDNGIAIEGLVKQGVSKEEREARVEMPILGEWRRVGGKPQGEHSSRPPAARAAQRPKPPEPDLDAPEDDIPF